MPASAPADGSRHHTVTTTAGPSGPAAARPVRVGTYNLHHGAPPGRSFDRRGLARDVNRLGVDLLALQEVDRRVFRSRWSDQLAIVSGATGLHGVFARARRLGPFGQYGVALLARTPPTAVEVVRLPSFGAEQRLAIIASVELPVGSGSGPGPGVSRRVSVAAVHLQNRHWIAARQLPVVLDRLLDRPGPHLLLGDLNAGPDRLGPSIEAAGLTAVAAPPTFPTRAADEHLDWIAGAGLELVEPEVPSLWTSDHFPLVATVR